MTQRRLGIRTLLGGERIRKAVAESPEGDALFTMWLLLEVNSLFLGSPEKLYVNLSLWALRRSMVNSADYRAPWYIAGTSSDPGSIILHENFRRILPNNPCP